MEIRFHRSPLLASASSPGRGVLVVSVIIICLFFGHGTGETDTTFRSHLLVTFPRRTLAYFSSAFQEGGFACPGPRALR